MMNFKEWIKPELFVLVPVLYLIGMGLKKSKLPDACIPLVLGGISILLSAAWVLSTCNVSTLQEGAYALFVSVTQGILSAGASVYFHQIYTQSKKRKAEKERNVL